MTVLQLNRHGKRSLEAAEHRLPGTMADRALPVVWADRRRDRLGGDEGQNTPPIQTRICSGFHALGMRKDEGAESRVESSGLRVPSGDCRLRVVGWSGECRRWRPAGEARASFRGLTSLRIHTGGSTSTYGVCPASIRRDYGGSLTQAPFGTGPPLFAPPVITCG